MKRFLSIILSFILLAGIVSGCADSKTQSPIRIGMLKGPTGIGAVRLMEQNDKGESINKYEFTVLGAPTDIVSAVASGSLDIAALPTNVACSLYNKTQGGVKIIAVNTLGVLYILEKGDSIKSIADLEGKTIFATGQGSTPEFALNHILKKNGLDNKVKIIYLDSEELATRAASGDADVCLLPVPNVTSVLLKNPDMRKAIDLNDEWAKIESDSVLSMGCVVVSAEFQKNNPQAVNDFLKEYEASINYAKTNTDAAAALCESYGIIPSAAVAKNAIPDSALTFISGEDMKDKLEGYYNVLFDSDAASIGGKLPDENFYLK